MVVTDPAGRNPMVVLSLEQFEAMTEMESFDRADKWDSSGFDETDYEDPIALNDILDDAAEESLNQPTKAVADEFGLLIPPIPSEKEVGNTPAAASKIASAPPKSNLDMFAESPLEEGFYLEPLEDK